MTEATLNKFDKLVRDVARLIRKTADEVLLVKESSQGAKKTPKPPLWQSAFLDMRLFADAKGGTGKLRIVLPSGELLGRVRISSEISILQYKIEELRRADETANWFGLKIIVTPKGKSTYELDTNPDCVVDPTWYDS